MYWAELELALALAQEAAMGLRTHPGWRSRSHLKPDGSVVTEGDAWSEGLIRAGLSQAFPQDGLLGEEGLFEPEQMKRPRCWIIDPLDGTSEYAKGRADYAVMIGLMEQGRPVMGVINAPDHQHLWYGAEGLGAFEQRAGGQREALKIRPLGERPRAVISKRILRLEMAQILIQIGVGDLQHRGGVGIKVGQVFSGEAELYLHLGGKIHHWDCCAPEAIARAAGLCFTGSDGQPLRYSSEATENHAGILLAAPELHRQAAEISAELWPLRIDVDES